MTIPHWYPIFLKEFLHFRRKLFKLGYIFSAMVSPILYLIAFGLGLGNRVTIGTVDYLTFLIPGLVAMSSMNNAYTWVASTVNLSRLYFKTFQVFIQAPIASSSIVIGEILAGMVKGIFASLLVIIIGYLTSPHFSMTGPFVCALVINTFLFATLGVIVGMCTKSHEETATYSNFVILPMAFFCGTFFPLDRVPYLLKGLIYLLPLTHTNILIRKVAMDGAAWVSLAVLVLYGVIFFWWGKKLVDDYDE